MKRLVVWLLLGAPAFAQTLPAGFFGNDFNVYTNVGTVTTNGCRTFSALNWRLINTASGTYTWTTFDNYRTACSNNNVILTMAGTPNYASSTSAASCSSAVGNTGNGGCNPPSDVATGDTQWTTWVTALAQHWAAADTTHAHYYEIWNEPNEDATASSGSQMWLGTLANLAQMACDAYTIIHANDAQGVVLSPSPTFDPRWIQSSPLGIANWFNQYLPVAQTQSGLSSGAASVCFDALAFHDYPHVFIPNNAGSYNTYYSGQSNPELQINYLPAIKAVMTTYNIGSLPMYVTEGNWGGNFGNQPVPPSTQWQSGQMMEWHLLLLNGGVGKVWWYQADGGFTGTSCIANWGGLWNPNIPGLCAQGIAYNWFLSLLSGGGYRAGANQPCARSNDGTWVCQLTRGDTGRPIYFIWNYIVGQYSQGTKIVSIPANAAAVLNVDQTAATVTNNTVTLPASGIPIIIEM